MSYKILGLVASLGEGDTYTFTATTETVISKIVIYNNSAYDTSNTFVKIDKSGPTYSPMNLYRLQLAPYETAECGGGICLQAGDSVQVNENAVYAEVVIFGAEL